jgi:hypothetical protein
MKPIGAVDDVGMAGAQAVIGMWSLMAMAHCGGKAELSQGDVEGFSQV